MPANYWISSFCPPVWDGETSVQIDPLEYEELLKRDWDATIVATNLSCYTSVLSWELIEKNGLVLQGGLDSSKKVVHIDGSIEGMAAFAIWHKNLVSKDNPLHFFDEGSSAILEINDHTQPSDIVEGIRLRRKQC